MKLVEKRLKIGGRITNKQKEILNLYQNQFYTAKQISFRLKTSLQYVYKTLEILKEKGAINELVEKMGGSIQPFNHPLRLHGQQFVIRILWKDRKYRELLKKCNIINFDGATVKLHDGIVEIYGLKSFFGNDEAQIMANSMDFYNRLIRKLENDLKIILLKSRSANIRMVKAHFAETNNEIAKDQEKSRAIKVYAREDGKLWFLIDNSFNFHEAETVKASTSQEDMRRIRKHFNDIRDNDPPTITEVMNLLKLEIIPVLKEIVVINRENAAGLNVIIKLITPKDLEVKKQPEMVGRPDYCG